VAFVYTLLCDIVIVYNGSDVVCSYAGQNVTTPSCGVDVKRTTVCTI